MRRRLTAAIVAVAAAAVALFAVPLGVVLGQGYRDEELLRLQRDTVAAARQIDLGSSATDPVEFPASGDRFAVYDRAGRRVAERGGGSPASADPAVSEVLRTRRPAVRHPPGALVAVVPLLTGERVTGVIRAQRSDAAVERRSHNAWLALGAVVLALIALAALAAVLLGRRLAVPLEHVALAAQRLGEGDFSVRAPPASVAEVDDVAGALNATAARLGELVSRERAFTENASHQLRTPLAALRIDLEAMQINGTDPDHVEPAIAQVDRLQTTIETLLSVARDTPPAQGQAGFGEVLEGVQERWRERLARDGRPLRTVVSAVAGQAVVSAAPGIVAEVLDVLVDNAHRHGAGAVTVSARAIGDWWALDVQDEGPGVPEGDGVFEATAGSSAGHGLGLALARSLAHSEGARLTLTRASPHPVFTVLLRGC